MHDMLRPHSEDLSRRARRLACREQQPHVSFRDWLQRRWSQFSTGFLNYPGMGSVVETFESSPFWGRFTDLKYFPANIYSGATDSTNTPTTNLRPGLIMGVITSTGQWTNYSATATDGSQVARGILPVGLTMYDPLLGANQNKVGPIVIGGCAKASQLLGFDLNARADLSPNFIFDDNVIGNFRYPWQNFVTKTGNYTVVASDNLTMFDTFGATGAVNFTLPTLANGYCFGFRNRADQNLTVTSAAGGDMEALNNLIASSVAFSTGSAKIGGEFVVYSTPTGNRWIVETRSAGANTVTVA